MVEFALSFPFLLVILFSVLFFGQYFLASQSLLYAAQQGALAASCTPGLSVNGDTLNSVRGFTTSGAAYNTNAVIFNALRSANLLTGNNLPANAAVEILPFDSDPTEIVPIGTIEVKIVYPFKPFGIIFGNSLGVAATTNTNQMLVSFANFNITERAVVGEQVYQQQTTP